MIDAAMTAKLQTVRTALVETIPRFEAEFRAGDLARTTGDAEQ